MYRQRHKRCSFRAAKGFSLLELLLALAVLMGLLVLAQARF